jgi:hypothetical protein
MYEYTCKECGTYCMFEGTAYKKPSKNWICNTRIFDMDKKEYTICNSKEYIKAERESMEYYTQ